MTTTWNLLQQVFTVETLMTPRDQLFTCHHTTDPETIRSHADQHHFDLIPLTDNGRIVTIWSRDTQQPEPLTDQCLVSRDTCIPHLLNILVDCRRLGLLIFHRQDVTGLVTPADLNKLPARVYFYNLIGELELQFAAFVANHFTDQPAQLLTLLGKKRRENLAENQAQLSEGNADIELVQYLYLSDLITIIRKEEGLRSLLGFASAEQVNKTLGGLNKLRNSTMHLVRPVLHQVPDDLLRLHNRVQRATDILDKLETLP